MKRLFFFITFCIFLNTNLLGQRLECIAAVNYNIFHGLDLAGPAADSPEDYTNGFGYAFSIGVDDIKFGKVPFRFTLKYDHYTGGTSYYYSGHGDGKQYDINVKKDMLGFGIYPINATFFHNLKFSMGAEFNFLVHSQQNGSQSSWHLTPNGPYPYTTSSSTIDNSSKNINQVFNFGINTSLRYEFSLSQNLRIAPQAMLYLSMNNEFNSPFEDSRSIRPYLGFAIIKNLKKKN